MTPYIGCETARELLDAFVDGELPVGEQVMVEAHLRWCQTCTARVEDLSAIGDAIRQGPPRVAVHADDARALAAVQGAVLGRLRAERATSLATRSREVFADMRLFWPALGATAAVAFCVLGVLGVLQLTRHEQPDSLKALIATMSDPGSDRNPLRLDDTVAIPRALDEGLMLTGADDEALFAVATVVTREGRISNYSLLQTPRDVVRANHRHDRDVAAVLDAVRHSRFEPARALTGRTVAVNMVWLIARTTVKAPAGEVDLFELRPVPRRKPEAPKPAAAEPESEPADVHSPTPDPSPTV